MSIDKNWEKHCAGMVKVGRLIEEIAAELPVTASAAKLRKAVSTAWSEITASADEIEQLLTAYVQPLPVEFPWKDKEFQALWKLYKDYLVEQHGLTMKSRMETARLKAVATMWNNDRQAVCQALNFYMAVGSATIFYYELKNNSEIKDGKQIVYL